MDFLCGGCRRGGLYKGSLGIECRVQEQNRVKGVTRIAQYWWLP